MIHGRRGFRIDHGKPLSVDVVAFPRVWRGCWCGQGGGRRGCGGLWFSGGKYRRRGRSWIRWSSSSLLFLSKLMGESLIIINVWLCWIH